MARRSVLICDGKGCGAVLLEEHDGFLIHGTISTGLTESPKTLVGNNDDDAAPSPDGSPETALCEKCLLEALGLGK